MMVCLVSVAILLLKAASQWQGQHGSKLPQGSTQRSEFKQIIQSWQRSIDGVPIEVSCPAQQPAESHRAPTLNFLVPCRRTTSMKHCHMPTSTGPPQAFVSMPACLLLWSFCKRLMCSQCLQLQR